MRLLSFFAHEFCATRDFLCRFFVQFRIFCCCCWVICHFVLHPNCFEWIFSQKTATNRMKIDWIHRELIDNFLEGSRMKSMEANVITHVFHVRNYNTASTFVPVLQYAILSSLFHFARAFPWLKCRTFLFNLFFPSFCTQTWLEPSSDIQIVGVVWYWLARMNGISLFSTIKF